MLYVQVENFNSQVVAGIRYTFDLVLGLVNSPVKFKNLIAKSLGFSDSSSVSVTEPEGPVVGLFFLT